MNALYVVRTADYHNYYVIAKSIMEAEEKVNVYREINNSIISQEGDLITKEGKKIKSIELLTEELIK